MPFETEADLDSFFEELGTTAVITGPEVDPPDEQFTKTILAIFDLSSEAIDAYGDTDIDADDPSMSCKTVDLADVAKGYTVEFPELEAHEDGYAKTYTLMRFSKDGPQTTKVTLKEV